MALKLNPFVSQSQKLPGFSLPPMASFRSPKVRMAYTLNSRTKWVGFFPCFFFSSMPILSFAYKPWIFACFLRFSADFGSGFLFPHCNLASVFITYSCVVLWSCCLCLQTLFSIFGYQIWKFQQFFNNHGPCFCSLPVVMCCFALIWFEWKLLQVCSRWVLFFACDALLIHLLIVVPFKFSFYNLNSQRCAFLFRVSIHICFIKVFIFWEFNSSLYIVQLNILVFIVYFLTSKYFFFLKKNCWSGGSIVFIA